VEIQAPQTRRHRERLKAHALRRAAPICYFSNVKNSTNVISAKPINNVLWPHRATIPSMFQSPQFTRIDNRRYTSAAQVLYGGGTVHFQVNSNDAAGLKNADLRHISSEIALLGRQPGA
jgi:hypothetical protein